MLETTHDPIGDFVNAATSDVVDFTGRHDFESFKHNTDKLNELETYRQLAVRASQCGYRINKVVYRGYGAPDRLQQMHDQAIEARTKLQLERATEQQAQDLENFKLESQMHRAGKRRHEQTAEVAHQLELDQKKHEAELRAREAQATFQREQQRLDARVAGRAAHPAGPAPARAPGRAASAGRGPDRLPDPGPRRPRDRAPRPARRCGAPAPRPVASPDGSRSRSDGTDGSAV